mgnify:FL=1
MLGSDIFRALAVVGLGWVGEVLVLLGFIRTTAPPVLALPDGVRNRVGETVHAATRLRFGLLSAEGPNTRGAVDRLADELRELASCPEAISALAKVRHRAAAARAPETPKVAAPYAENEMVEIQLTADPTSWVPAEYLNTSHGGSLIAVWSERCGSLVVPKERVRAVNRPSLSDVG